MIEKILYKKFSVSIRYVEERDASFILQLRTDERLGRFLSATSSDLEKQEEWIRGYKERESSDKEFYFLYESVNGVKYGVNRIYNISDVSFEVGSWLFSRESPEGVSVLADLYSRDFAFGKFNFDFCHFEVRKANKNVVNYHKRYNPELVGEDNLNYYFKLSKDNYFTYRDKLIKLYSYGIK